MRLRAATFGVPLHCHELEAVAVRQICTVAGTFADLHSLGTDFEIIPTPGHTPGATAYLWDSGERRCQFTGDTFQPRADRWIAVLLDGGDRDRYIDSLELMRTLDFDVVVPWVRARWAAVLQAGQWGRNRARARRSARPPPPR